MAITSSAKKVIRASERKRIFNLRRIRTVDSVTKKIEKLVADKKIKEAQAAIPEAYKAIDKAVKTNYLKFNTGSRKKSRLVAFINKAAHSTGSTGSPQAGSGQAGLTKVGK